jgi:cell division protein FtsN
MVARKGRQAVRNGGFLSWWAWVLIGVAGGALLMLLVVRGGMLPITREQTGPEPNPLATAPHGSEPGIADQPAADNAPKKPSYDFYSVLPEKEVVIPDAEISAQAKAESQQAQQAGDATPAAAAAAAVTDDNGYLLQVGSFPSADDAEAMKAKLALQGFVASIQPVTINGQTWNRVRLGPFGSASDLEAAKQKLSAAGINAIALKETH